MAVCWDRRERRSEIQRSRRRWETATHLALGTPAKDQQEIEITPKTRRVGGGFLPMFLSMYMQLLFETHLQELNGLGACPRPMVLKLFN